MAMFWATWFEQFDALLPLGDIDDAQLPPYQCTICKTVWVVVIFVSVKVSLAVVAILNGVYPKSYWLLSEN